MQKGYQFETSLGYTMSSRPAWGTQQDPVSKQTKQLPSFQGRAK
jgi:hypothetical protein